MGKQTSKPLQQIQLSLNHPRFTNSKFIVNDKQRHMQNIMGVDNKQYDKWKDRLHKLGPSPNYLLLPIKEDFASKGLCGSSGTLTLDYEDFPYLLTQQINHRKGKRKLFQESQLWYLLFALIAAKRDMKPQFSKIGDVRPQNIFINQKSEIKIANTFSWPHQSTNFVKAFDNQATYLAPQQLEQLANGTIQNQKNDLSEMFSIGLTILSAATLQDFSNCYQLKKYSLHLQKINEKLNQFKVSRSYSDIFKGVVCNLCEYSIIKRVTPQQLWNWIAPHQEKIKARQNFFIPSAPQKIHQQVALIRQYASTQVSTHASQLQNSGGFRQSSFSGQKLNFPPPIIRSSIPEHSNFQTFNNFSNPLVNNAESTYIPASKLSQGDVTGDSSKINSNNKTTDNNLQSGAQTNTVGSQQDSSKKQEVSVSQKKI